MSIRLAGPRDGSAVAAIYAPSISNGVASFEYDVPDAAEMVRRIEHTLPNMPWVVCEQGGNVVGYAYAGQHRERAAYQWSVNVSVYIRSDCHRGGIGRALYESLLALLRLQGFYHAYAGITLPNPASVGLHESLGFKPVGVYHSVGYKNGQWHDVGWWELELQPRCENPRPTQPLDGSTRWDGALQTGWEVAAMIPKFRHVVEASHRLRGQVVRTPLVRASGACFKAENLQRSGSFKLRGALNRLLGLSPEERRRGVVCFSSGNHAQAVALAGKLLGVVVTVFMPEDSMPHKVVETRAYGAEVCQEGVTPTTRHRLAADFAREHGAVLVPPFDDPAIVAGQGTAGLELVEQYPEVESVAVPLGGGGLLSGMALAVHGLRPRARLYGVEPARGNDGQQSLRSGQRVTIDAPDTIADGARTIALGELTFEVIRQHVTDILTVDDDALLDAIRYLALEHKIVAEPTGALAVAAWRAGLVPGHEVALVISGGNVSPALLATALSRA